MFEERFGKCAKCGGVSTCIIGKHNIEIVSISCAHDNYAPAHSFDLCDSCIDFIVDWCYNEKLEEEEIKDMS